MTRIRGFASVEKSALEKKFFFVFFSLSLGFSHTCNCLLRTYSKRLTGEIRLGKYHFPAKCHFACCESQRFHILLAGGLQRRPGVDITVYRGAKYLEDQNRRYGRDKMPPLLCRILKLRKISAKHVLNNKGQKCVSANTFLLAASKSCLFAKFFKTPL